jgi:uncharacterized membrane-anchored protein
MSGQAGVGVLDAAVIAVAERSDSQKIAITVGIVVMLVVGLVGVGALLYAVFQAFGEWLGDAMEQPWWYLGVPVIPGGIAFLTVAAVQPSVVVALIVGGVVGLVAGIWVAGS